MLNLLVIKTKDCVYISNDAKSSRVFDSITNYIFDGKEPKPTFQREWFELPEIPSKIERKISATKKRTHWKLMEKYIPQENLPKILEVAYDITDDDAEDNEWFDLSPLYVPVYEETPETFENVEFQIAIVESFDGVFKFSKQDYNPEYNLLDKINTHPALLELKPCKLSKAESYGIIRRHIKANIDTRYAKITSDYDFCLTVCKNIKHDPLPYQYNKGTLKKPKYTTMYRNERQVTIFQVAPKAYQSYNVVEEFSGENYQDMKNKIDTFLENLMEVINEPYEECPHCSGMGVILNANN